MINQNILITFVVIVVLKSQLSVAQDNSLTFSPSTLLCIGELVQLICYVVPPTAEQFTDSVALISFNDSVVASLNTINNDGLAGVDTSRYTADIAGLGTTTDKPGIRLTITDYQASDGATSFSCHGAYSGGVPSPVIISGTPQRLAEPVILTSSTLTVKSNISEDSRIFVSIQHDVSIVDRPDTLMYNLVLYSYGAVEDSLTLLSLDEATSTPFATKFIPDNYYQISVTAENCAGGSGSVNSKTFVLLGIRPDTGKFQTSSSNSSRIEWLYTNLDTSAGPFEQDYLPEEYFTFTIDSESITEFSLYLPQRFDFALPPGYDSSSRQGLLEISFNDILLAKITIVFEQTSDNTLTIILSLFLAVLIILMCVLFLIIVYVCCFRNRSNKANKKSIHLYEDVNETRTHDYVVMNRQKGTAVTQQSESQHYTHMSALDRKQLSPNYENMNKF